jgi:hypothetical protein
MKPNQTSNPEKPKYTKLGHHIQYSATTITMEENSGLPQKSETIKKYTSDPLGLPYY